MARERGRQRSVEFELLPDAEDLGPLDEPAHSYVVVAPAATGQDADDDATDPPVIEPSLVTKAARRTCAWLRGRTPVQLVAAAIVVALAVGAGIAVDHAHHREHAARLGEARGGVVDLSERGEHLWTTDLEVDGSSELGQTVLAVLDGGVLVVSHAFGEMVRQQAPPGETTWTITSDGGATVTTITGVDGFDRFEQHGQQLHGIDTATGEILWTHRIESTDLTCTATTAGLSWPAAFESSRTAAHLLCVTGRGTDTEVTVIDPQGATTTVRPDDAADSTRFLPGPDDLLWRFDWAADLPDDALPALADGTPDRSGLWLLRGTDPLTGETRWQRLAGSAADAGNAECLVQDDHGRVQPTERLLSVWSSSGREVTVWGCGFGELLGPGGAVRGTDLGGIVRSVPLADGGSAQTDGTLGTLARPRQPQTVLDDDGEVFAALGGSVLDPLTTDGRGGVDLTVPAADRPADGALFWTDGYDVGAIDGHGEERWRVPVEQEFIEGAVARAGHVIVLQTSWSASRGPHLLALDQRTGNRVWEVPMGTVGGLWGGGGFVAGAWTDGDVLVLAMPGFSSDAEAPYVWTAYDLRNGQVVWQRTFDGDDPALGWRGTCTSATGALVCLGGGRVTRVA